jgi:hypothetical protein
MIYNTYFKARFSTVAKRNAALTRVNNYIAAQAIFDDLFVPAQVAALDAGYKGWANAITVECRFRTQANRDQLWTDIDTYLSQASSAPVESYGEKWDQMLDAPNPDADTTRYNFVSKTWT